MRTLTIRNVPATVVSSLKALARRRRHSMEQEIRELLEIHISERRSVLDQIEAAWSRQSRLFLAQAAEYRNRTEKALRADIQLAIAADRRRTAHAVAKRLVASNPTADNLLTLADTYRALA